MPFKSLGVSKVLADSITKQKISEPTEIQKLVIPEILQGKDVLGIAQTGSGKTLSFVLPLLMKVLSNKQYKNRHIKSLILAPTRELAVQIHQVIQLYSADLYRHIKSMAVYGGVSINPQMKGLQNVEILIATPGRLLDLYRSKAVFFSHIDILVLDEADKLLNLGFQKEIDEILSLVPKAKQSLLFSATLSEDLTEIQKLLLNDPSVINISTEEENIDLIDQKAYHITEETKGPFLRWLIKNQNWEQILVFTSSGRKAEKVAHKLSKNGINASAIHGKMSQGARLTALSQFKTKELQVLVATDLISRGIDIDALPCVINYELPRSPKDYIHRIGRTGRAGISGSAISLLTDDDLHHFKVIMKKMNLWTEVESTDDVDLHGF